MSTIFTTTTTTKTAPRLDATIRVEAYQPDLPGTTKYIVVDLLEFHPDTDGRMKMRGFALVRPNDALTNGGTRPNVGGVYHMCGAGWLEQPYARVREFIIHPADREEMTAWCYQVGKPIVIHKQPVPFPMFKKGVRVVVLAYKDDYTDTAAAGQAGQFAITTERGGEGGMTQVHFEDEALNKGYKSLSVPSIALREAKA